MHKLTTELSGDIIFEGTQIECERVLEAFKKYGVGERKFIITPPEKWMSDNLREEIEDYIVDNESEWAFADGAKLDIVKFGSHFPGVINQSDDDLLEEMLNYTDEGEDDNFKPNKLYKMAVAEKEIHKMLTE